MHFFIEFGLELSPAVLLQSTERRRPNNSEQPRTGIPAPERAKVSKSPQACLLNHVFRIVAVPQKPRAGCEPSDAGEISSKLPISVSRCSLFMP
jgi:hypothetical protein